MHQPNPTGRLSDVTIPSDSVVDLHMHTTASDGRYTPEGLAQAAHELKLAVIALADHDRVDNIRPLQEEAARYGIHVIPAVEVSSQWDGTVYHLLLYNVDLTDERVVGPFDALKRQDSPRSVAARRNIKVSTLQARRRDVDAEAAAAD